MERLRRVAGALGIEWPADRSYPEVVHGLDPTVATHAAFLEQAVTTLRGAGYSLLDGTTTIGNAPVHSALATPYAHVTAPLRRLADRFANEVLIDLFADRTPTAELVGALVPLPDIMREGSRKVSAVDRAVVDLAEALVLRGREGSEFAAVVVDLDDRGASVLLRNPAVIATIPSTGVELGTEVRVRLDAVHPAERRVQFSPVG